MDFESDCPHEFPLNVLIRVGQVNNNKTKKWNNKI